jgi:hypothetical protein
VHLAPNRVISEHSDAAGRYYWEAGSVRVRFRRAEVCHVTVVVWEEEQLGQKKQRVISALEAVLVKSQPALEDRFRRR